MKAGQLGKLDGMKTVRADQLQVGDKLIATNRTVTHAPSAGVKTPTGKVDLGLDGRPNQFWKHTMIIIIRHEVDKERAD